MSEFKLTAAQEGIWLGHQKSEDPSIYNAAQYFEISGEIDPLLFKKAFTHLVSETEGLKLSFTGESEPSVQVLDKVTFDFQIIDLADGPQINIEELVRKELRKNPPLENGGLFKSGLYKMAENEWVWYFCAHHILLDGYGFSLVTQRVAQIYSALAKGEVYTPAQLPPVSLALNEDIKYRESKAFERDRDFWREICFNRTNPVSFKAADFDIDINTHKSHSVITESQCRLLKKIAEECGTHWGNVLIAVIASELYAQTGVDKVTLGLPVMNRLGSVLSMIPCMHMNIVPFPVDLSAEMNFSDLIKQVAETQNSVKRHQRYRYEDLRRDLSDKKDFLRLFGPVINIMPFDIPADFAGFPCTQQTVSAGPVEDLAFSIIPQGQSLSFEVEGNGGKYSLEDIQSLLNSVTDRLTDLVQNPQKTCVDSIEIQKKFLIEGPTANTPADIIDELIKNAEKNPEKAALVSSSASLTYEQFLTSVKSLAAVIEKKSPDKNAPVAIMIPRSIDTICAIMACLWSGRTYMPIDCKAPKNRQEFMLEDAGVDLLLTAEQIGFSKPGLQELILDCIKLAESDLQPCYGDGAYIMYTSGSTGKPKGVLVSRNSLNHFAKAAVDTYEVSENERILQFAPFHFDASVEEIFCTFSAGATLILRNEECLESLDSFCEFCESMQTSFIDLPTAYWNELVYALESKAVSLPESVKTVIIGGEAALNEKVSSWIKNVPVDVKLWNTYGPTEATVVTSAKLITSDYSEEGDIPIGQLLPNVKAVIVDAEGRLALPGERGELLLIGPQLAEGYLNQSAETAEKFINIHCFGRPEKAYRSGDLVYLNENGDLVYQGRKDFEFKVSGHRINPLEIENAISSHPLINEAAVIGQSAANGMKYLQAHLVSEEEISVSELRQFLLGILPEAVIPGQFLYWDKLPMSSNGKVDRKKLAGMAKSSASTPTRDLSEEEQIILECWEEILGIEGISLEQDFFELGGQSLQCIQLANRLSKRLNIKVKVATLFKYPVCSELAEYFSSNSGTEEKKLPEQLLEDCVLPTDICSTELPESHSLKNVLLTGASGFVGIHLLHSLLQKNCTVHCLVRCSDEKEGMAKVLAAFAKEKIPVNTKLLAGIIILKGGLTADRLGLDKNTYDRLAETVDSVFHNAAQVSVVRSYNSLRKVNVLSTLELIRFASTKVKKTFNYVSTQAVFPQITDFPELHETYYEVHKGLKDGYQQSKWASEELLRQASERGLNVSVYRLGRVSGATGTGLFNTQDLYWSLVSCGLNVKALPLLDVKEVWTPVDYVGKVVVELAANSTSGVYHIISEQMAEFSQLNKWLSEFGFEFDMLNIPQWLQLVAEKGREEDQSLLAFFEMNKPENEDDNTPVKQGRILDNNTRNQLPHDWEFPRLTRENFFKYLNWGIAQGVLPEKSGVLL